MNIWYRILIALVFIIGLNLIVPPLFRIIGFPLSADAELITRVCIAAIGLIYVLTGRPIIAP